MILNYTKKGVAYSFGVKEDGRGGCENVLVVSDGEKVARIPCRQADGIAIRFNKKSLAANGGARGVFDFLKWCIDSDIATCYVDRVINMYL